MQHYNSLNFQAYRPKVLVYPNSGLTVNPKKHLQMNRYKIMEVMQFGTNTIEEL